MSSLQASPHTGISQAPGRHQVTAALFTTGELALLSRYKPPRRLLALIQSFTSQQLLPRQPPPASQQHPLPGGQMHDLPRGHLDEGMHLAPPERGPSSHWIPVPTDLRSLAWAALGKLCIVDEVLAKQTVPSMVQVGEGGRACGQNHTTLALELWCWAQFFVHLCWD